MSGREMEPAGLEDEARDHLKAQREEAHGHYHEQSSGSEGGSFPGRLFQRKNWQRIGKTFFMDAQMLWKEVIIGVLIAGFPTVLVPADWWPNLFFAPGLRVAAIG